MTAYAKTAPPHIHDEASVPKIMWKTAAALVPLAGVCGFFYGADVLRVLGVSLLAAATSEVFACFLLTRESSLKDGSAAVTAILFGLLLPPDAPAAVIVLGSFVAIFLGREVFGGLGANPFNPALVGRMFLEVSFPGFFQSVPPMAEAGWIAILAGGIYLNCQKMVAWEIPWIYLAAFALPSRLLGMPWTGVCSGMLFLAAFFLATDPVTTPITKGGARIFALGAGILTAVLHAGAVRAAMDPPATLWPEPLLHDGPSPHLTASVGFAILMMNALTPWIDAWGRPKGARRKNGRKN